MKLDSVRLREFRGHRDTAVEFPDGVIALIGPNGGGKTTVLEAVEFAFYGASAVRKKLDSIRRRKAPKDSETSVDLHVTVSGDQYHLFRNLKTATLRRINEGGAHVMADSTSGVTEYVEKTLLGMTLKEFRASYLARQKDLEWLRGKGAAERERFLVKMLGYDAVRCAQADIRADARGTEKGLEHVQKLHTEMKVLSQNELDDLEAALKLLRGELLLAQSRLDHWREAVEGAEAREKEFHEAQERDAKATEPIARLTSQISGLESRIQMLTERRDQMKEIPEKVERLTAEIAETEGRIQTGEEEKQKHRQAHGEAVERLAALNQAQKVAKARLQKVERMEGKGECPLCGQPMDGHTHAQLVQDLKEEIEGREGSIQAAEGEKLKALEAGTALRWIETEKKQVGVWQGELNAVQEQKAEADQVVERLGLAIDALDKAKEELESARKRRRTIGYDSMAHFEARSELEEARSAKSKAEAEVRDLEKKVGDADRDLARWFQKAAEKERLGEEIRRLTVEAALERATEKMLGEFQGYLNELIRPTISATASELITEMSEGRFDELILDETYEPRLFSSGEEIEVLSGGEEDLANLAVRNAVADLIAQRSGKPMECIVLDEPFGSLDDGRQRSVMEALRTLTQKRFEQVVLVTHTLVAQDLADLAVSIDTNNGGD